MWYTTVLLVKAARMSWKRLRSWEYGHVGWMKGEEFGVGRTPVMRTTGAVSSVLGTKAHTEMRTSLLL